MNLTRWRELNERATPGPWKYSPWHIEEGPPVVLAAPDHIVASVDVNEHAELIALLRNLSPALLKVVEAAKKIDSGIYADFKEGLADLHGALAELAEKMGER